MVNFKISIAETTVEIKCLYESTKNFCCKYITDNPPDFTIEIVASDIEYERNRSYQEDERNNREKVQFSNEYLETLAVYRKIAEELPLYNTFLFHGSAVAIDGNGYVFTAKSGVGKSTHVGFYREKFADRAVMVNDDKPLILVNEKGVFVCGTPWSGKHELNTNIIVPLKAVCVLNRAEQNSISKVNFYSVLGKIYSQSYKPTSPQALKKVLQLLSEMSDKVNFFNLYCNKDPKSALISYEGMKKFET